MFVNRTQEGVLLLRWRDGQQSTFITLYSRRQVGKIKRYVHLIADVPAI